MSRILVHFSCGAASAVAWKITEMCFGAEADVEAIYCDLSKDEHPDNARFMADVERWVGKKVTILTHHRYKSIDDLFLDQRFMASKDGAICTKVMKRHVGDAYSRPDDRHVYGYTADERDRIKAFGERNPETKCLWVLAGITKSDCYRVLSAHGIELPAMYKMGYGHNNCIGCVKGGKGYWNMIRRDFPDVFARRALVQRELGEGAAFRSGGKGFMLDELSPEEGRGATEPDIECGVLCSSYASILEDAVAQQRSPEARAEKEAGT